MTTNDNHLLLILPRFGAQALALGGEDELDADSSILTDDDMGVRTIYAHGIMAAGAGGFIGYLDTTELRSVIMEAESDPNVSAVVIDWDSPGGYVTGVIEAADAVAMASKPIVSRVSGMCCSAAYWVAAASDSIIATPSAELGSIGVYVAHQDLSGMAAQMGIKVDVITSGKYKGAGVPGTSLTREQREMIQAQVNKLADRFKAAVGAERDVPEDAMEGQTFMGQDALEVGMADDIYSDPEDAVELALSLVDARP